MTDKQIVKPDLDTFLLFNESRRELVQLISEVKDGIGIRLETPETLSVLLNKIEYQTEPGNAELKIRPFVLVALDKTSSSNLIRRVRVIHIFNKTSIYLAVVGLGGLLAFALLCWFLVSRKSRSGYWQKRRFLGHYWPLTFRWE